MSFFYVYLANCYRAITMNSNLHSSGVDTSFCSLLYASLLKSKHLLLLLLFLFTFQPWTVPGHGLPLKNVRTPLLLLYSSYKQEVQSVCWVPFWIDMDEWGRQCQSSLELRQGLESKPITTTFLIINNPGYWPDHRHT